MPIPHVHPGDLVTAELLKRLIDALNALDARIAALEAGHRPHRR